MGVQGEVEGLDRICHELKRNRQAITAAVMEDWKSVQAGEPWLKLPDNLSQDHLPDLVAALADASLCTMFGDDERRTLAWTAVTHGMHRREEGYEESLLYHEYTLLRRALWHLIRDRFALTGLASAAVIRIDAAITLATGGSLRGYYRATLEAGGDWPRAVERLTDDFSFPGTD